MTLVHELWLAWGEDGWREDPKAIVGRVRILNHLADAAGLVEYAQREAKRLGVPAWREPWFGAALVVLDAALGIA